MGKPKWTPGPWRLFNRNRTIAVMVGEGPRNEVVSWTGFDASDFQKQNLANARLIAAAPDLYEALNAQEEAVNEHSICECHRHPDDFLCSMCAACVARYTRASRMRTAALAKARGETP